MTGHDADFLGTELAIRTGPGFSEPTDAQRLINWDTVAVGSEMGAELRARRILERLKVYEKVGESAPTFPVRLLLSPNERILGVYWNQKPHDAVLVTSEGFRLRDAGGTQVATLTYSYDAANRLQSLADSVGGTITYGYDPLNRVISEQTPQGTVTYVPDDANRRSSMTVAGQPPVSYSWDAANRLQTTTRDTLAAGYAYDDANRRTQLTLPNGVIIGYAYDEVNRLTSLSYTGPGGPLGNLTYAYDKAYNRTLMGGSWARTILPAAIASASYDLANRQLALGGKSMTYDNNGNLATLTESGQTTTYTWDVRNRLTNIAGPVTASFAYDATGRRTTKTVASLETTFQYDAWDTVKEVSGGATVTYLSGLAIDEPLARIEDSGPTTCYVPDALGSPLALTDAGGVVTTSYTYGPFGESSVNGAASASFFQFTGRENDGTGLYYYRARYYSPSLARFLQEDPIRFAGGDVNLYRYASNNPTNATDPRGLLTGEQKAQYISQGIQNGMVAGGIAGAMMGGGLGLGTGPGAIAASPAGAAAGFVYGAAAGGALGGALTAGVIGAVELCQGLINKFSAGSQSGSGSGQGGTQVTSKTLWKGKGQERIDVENPNPGQRPGQLHYQDNEGNKYIYDFAENKFRDAPAKVKELLNDPGVQRAIEKGRKILGL